METRTYSAEVLEYLSRFDPRLLANQTGRRILTRLEPKLFALTYCLHHLTDDSNHVSFSEVHDDWFEQMLGLVKRGVEPREWRNAYVAPRSMGKSTMWFLLCPLWAGAHGHSNFVAAFADSAGQAETHLATFKQEVETNKLLQADYPGLAKPARRRGGAMKSDNRSMYESDGGFVFAAKGIDSASLGLKVGDKRPDLLIGDDIEPAASAYSTFQVEKRLATLTDAILPLNERARVALIGTVTMTDSIIHQLVKTRTTVEPPAAWVVDENFSCHYYPAIATGTDGTERSVWPEKWSYDFLNGIRHTRSFKLNYENNPIGAEGGYWTPEDFRYDPPSVVSRRVISIDPAVTTKRTSDQTAIAVVSYSASERRASVDEILGVRVKGEPLRNIVLGLLGRYPDTERILFERNQGGEMMAESVLHSMPVTVQTVHATVKKELRAEQLLAYYRRGDIAHTRPHPLLESQMQEFPMGIHDDLIDAVGQAVLFFAQPAPQRRSLRMSSV